MSEVRTANARYRRLHPVVPAARAKARALAEEWGLTELVDSLEWAVSELVTNAVRHGRAAPASPVLVTYRLSGSRLRVEVRDWADGMPRLGGAAPEGSDLSEGGRGLAIVATLSQRWGVTPRVVGKSVWFEMKVSPSPEESR